MPVEIVRKLVGGVWRTVRSDEGGGGGSQTVKRVRVPYSFDSPDILTTGVVIYTPDDGDVLAYYGTVISVETAFDGTTPKLNLGMGTNAAAFAQIDATQADSPLGGGGGVAPTGNALGSGEILDGTDVVLVLDDGSGGNPGSMQGAGEVILLILAA